MPGSKAISKESIGCCSKSIKQNVKASAQNPNTSIYVACGQIEASYITVTHLYNTLSKATQRPVLYVMCMIPCEITMSITTFVHVDYAK